MPINNNKIARKSKDPDKAKFFYSFSTNLKGQSEQFLLGQVLVEISSKKDQNFCSHCKGTYCKAGQGGFIPVTRVNTTFIKKKNKDMS